MTLALRADGAALKTREAGVRFLFQVSVLCPYSHPTGEIAMHTLRSARRLLVLSALACLPCLLPTIAAYGADPPDAERTRNEITTMLTTFLTPAVNNTAEGHRSFWADDLVYTSSSGQVIN